LNSPAISILLRSTLFAVAIAAAAPVTMAEPVYIPTREEMAAGDVQIIAGESKTVYEYRVNGRLLAIKIVPKLGATYYMVPADGEAHYESLDHKKKLYPQWVIAEF